MSPIRKLIHLGSRTGSLLIAIGANADTLHVPADYATIQAAIDAAVSGLDEVVVANGSYTGTGNRDLDFGGRAITVRSAGGAANCIIDCAAAGRAFHFHSGETDASVLDGFTIRNGLAPTGSAILCELASGPTITNCVFNGNHATATGEIDFPRGGALECLASAPTITDCVFQANTAAGSGGAVGCVDGGDAEFTDCRFEDNTAGSAGALFIFRSSPTLTDCLFIRNESDFCCGAGMAYDNSSVHLTRCMFLENVQHGYNLGGGGFLVQLNSQADVRDCVFSGNSTAESGGGLTCSNGSELTMTNTTFLANEATFAGGGVVIQRNSRAHARDCVLTGNVANGIRNGGGGFVVQYNSQADIRDSAFIGNFSYNSGGGIWCGDDSDLTLTNATFGSNKVNIGAGAIRISRNTNGTATLLNCILWNDSPVEITLNLAAVTVMHSDVHNGWPGVGNISSDPLFVSNPNPGPDGFWGTPDDDYGDVRLTASSPCIDAGDPAFAPAPCAHDLEGACRVWDGNGNASARVDIGAYEFAAPSGDLDRDCQIGLSDLTTLLSALGTPENASPRDGDFDHDGDVDLSDLTIMLANFGTTCP